MKASSNDSDLPIIAMLFMLLLIYCTVCTRPAPDVTAAPDSTAATSATAIQFSTDAALGPVELHLLK